MKENIAAERAVLSGLCQYGVELFYEIDYLDVNTFSSLENQNLFRCFQKIFQDSQSIDLSSIFSAATAIGIYEQIATDDEVGFIRSLFNMGISRESTIANAKRLAKLKFINDADRLSDSIKRSLRETTGDEPISNLIEMLEGPVLEFTAQMYQDGDSGPERISDGVDEYLKELAENPVDMIGISTGFKHFDRSIGGGLRRKCVDLVGARPKSGKSFTCDAVAMNISARQIPVLVLDTEMGKKDHVNRMLGCLSEVPIDDIATGKFSLDDNKYRKVNQGKEEFKQLTYDYVSVAGKSFPTILGIIRNWIYRKVGFDASGRTNDCVVIYDYLKLMSAEGINPSMQEYQMLGFQITQLHNFAVKYDIPVLSFVQLNRDGITKESTDVASGSDRLIWLCTSFSILKPKSEEELANDGPDKGNRKLVPVVSRHGGGLDDGDYINMNFNFPIGKVTELETRNYYYKNQRGFQGDTQGTDISDN